MKNRACVLVALLMLMSVSFAEAQVEIAAETLPQGDPQEATEELGELAETIGDMEALDGEGRAYQRGDYAEGAFTQIAIEEYAEDEAGTRVENMGFADLSVYGITVGMGAEAARAILGADGALREVRPEYASDSEIVFECEGRGGFLALTVEDGKVASFVYQNFEDADWYY